MVKINRDLTINGVSIGHLATYGVSYENIYNNSIKTVDGTEYRDFVGVKRHLNITIETVDKDLVSTIINAIHDQRPATVYYYDVKAKDYLTKTFYFDDTVDTDIKFWFEDSTNYFSQIPITAVEEGVS